MGAVSKIFQIWKLWWLLRLRRTNVDSFKAGKNEHAMFTKPRAFGMPAVRALRLFSSESCIRCMCVGGGEICSNLLAGALYYTHLLCFACKLSFKILGAKMP